MFVCRSECGPTALPAPPGLSGPQLCTRTMQLLGRVTFLAVLPLPGHENLSWVRLFLLGGFLATVVSQLGALCLCSLKLRSSMQHSDAQSFLSAGMSPSGWSAQYTEAVLDWQTCEAGCLSFAIL